MFGAGLAFPQAAGCRAELVSTDGQLGMGAAQAEAGSTHPRALARRLQALRSNSAPRRGCVLDAPRGPEARAVPATGPDRRSAITPLTTPTTAAPSAARTTSQPALPYGAATADTCTPSAEHRNAHAPQHPAPYEPSQRTPGCSTQPQQHPKAMHRANSPEVPAPARSTLKRNTPREAPATPRPRRTCARDRDVAHVDISTCTSALAAHVDGQVPERTPSAECSAAARPHGRAPAGVVPQCHAHVDHRKLCAEIQTAERELGARPFTRGRGPIALRAPNGARHQPRTLGKNGRWPWPGW